MTNTELKLADLDRQEKSAKQAIKLGDALNRLRKNKDFETLIVQGYLHNEAVRLVHAKAEPHMQSPEAQANVIRDIDAVGVLGSFFNIIAQQADKATYILEQVEAERAFIANEEEDD